MSLRIRLKEYVLIIIGQACCLLVGLLLQHHQTASLLKNAWPDGPAGAVVDRLWLVEGSTFLWVIALSATMLYLQVGRHHDKLDEVQSILDTRVLQRSQALIRTRDAVIFAISRLADYRDHETGNHLERISGYSTVLAAELARHPKFADRVTPTFVRLIGVSSVLHDIGKIGIEDSILRKPGPLTTPQRERMQQHVLAADECLREIQQRMGRSSLLDMGRLIAVAHHEKWDGTGYPYGLAGEKIPLEARIVAVADVYDALSTRRVYKEAMPHETCVDLIRREAGRHFDPDIVETWLKIEHKFLEIARRHADRELAELDAASAALSPTSEPVPGGGDENRRVTVPAGAREELAGVDAPLFS